MNNIKKAKLHYSKFAFLYKYVELFVIKNVVKTLKMLYCVFVILEVFIMKELYPLTFSQKSIYYTEKLYQGTSINNVVGTVKIHTNVDFKMLLEAINIFIKNNDGIRIKVIEQNGQLFQYVEDFTDFDFDMVDFSSKDKKEFFAWEEREALIPFDFFDNYLFSFTLFKLNETEGGFLYKSNHIISDAWSMGLVGSNVVDIYSKLLENVDIENNSISYEKHILDEQEYISSEKFKKDENFWNNQLLIW